MNIPIPIIKNQQPYKNTFADILVRHVREKYCSNASAVYTAAWLDRRTWSAIVSDHHRPVAKRTAIQFAIALRLTRFEADELLLSAGHALSPAINEDVAFAYCIDRHIFDLFKVNQILYDCGLKIIPPK